jgi:adenylate kinase
LFPGIILPYLGQADLYIRPIAMAPVADEIVDNLKDLVHKLESRVQQLEARLEHGGPKPPRGLRMILMGPPGAGMLVFSEAFWLDGCSWYLGWLTFGIVGKGTQAPKIKDKFCVCHLVSLWIAQPEIRS